MGTLVLVRHGQSQWNLENRFTGWVDVPLTEKGQEEARKAGAILKSQNYQFSQAHTSYLQRAIHTLWYILGETEQQWLPVSKHWRLNERHYGGLQGLNKQETRDQYGDEKVFQWRRSYATLPPDATGEIQEALEADRRYQVIPKGQFPKGEALKQTLERVEPYWKESIAPALSRGEQVLVVAHGNSLRALVKLLTKMSEDEITEFEFETGVPLHLDLNSDLSLKEMRWISTK